MVQRLSSLLGLVLAAAAAAPAPAGPLTVPGQTVPVTGRSSLIVPQVLQPVREVKVKEGDTVKEGDIIIRLDDDEYVADVKVKTAKVDELKAQLQQLLKEPREQRIEQARADYEKAQVTTKAAQKRLDALEELHKKGAVAEKDYLEARTALAQARKDEEGTRQKVKELEKDPVASKAAGIEAQIRGAEADLELAKAQRDNLDIAARTTGVVTRLKAKPGLAVRPGTDVWAEIIDLTELDVRCDVTWAQFRTLKLGQSAAVADEGHELGRGKVVSLGKAADPVTGKLPVLVRLPNKDAAVPCYVPVRVTFGE